MCGGVLQRSGGIVVVKYDSGFRIGFDRKPGRCGMWDVLPLQYWAFAFGYYYDDNDVRCMMLQLQHYHYYHVP